MAKINMKAASSRVAMAAGLTAGVVASKFVKKTLEGVGGGRIKPVVNSAIRLGIGAFLPGLIGGKAKGGMVENVANGMMAEAATSLASAMGVPGLNGIDDDTISGDGEWMGSYNTNEDWLQGTDTTDTISGDEFED